MPASRRLPSIRWSGDTVTPRSVWHRDRQCSQPWCQRISTRAIIPHRVRWGLGDDPAAHVMPGDTEVRPLEGCLGAATAHVEAFFVYLDRPQLWGMNNRAVNRLGGRSERFSLGPFTTARHSRKHSSGKTAGSGDRPQCRRRQGGDASHDATGTAGPGGGGQPAPPPSAGANRSTWWSPGARRSIREQCQSKRGPAVPSPPPVTTVLARPGPVAPQPSPSSSARAPWTTTPTLFTPHHATGRSAAEPPCPRTGVVLG